MATPRTVRSGKLGKRALRLVDKEGHFYGLADGKVCVDDEDPDDVWRRLHDDAGKGDPRYFGFAGARSRFLKFFPGGFASESYAAHERDYKLVAKAKLDAGAPLADALIGEGFGEAVLAAYRATNMLSPFEKTRLQDVLRGPKADDFVRAAARFTDHPSKTTLFALEQVLAPYDCAKWTVATYLPYLWQPDAHMFLKPEVTKDFAVRVGHPFASIYEARLSFEVYESLLDLAEQTAMELTDLAPSDRIDIQSFIWIVGAYREEDMERPSEAG